MMIFGVSNNFKLQKYGKNILSRKECSQFVYLRGSQFTMVLKKAQITLTNMQEFSVRVENFIES